MEELSVPDSGQRKAQYLPEIFPAKEAKGMVCFAVENT